VVKITSLGDVLMALPALEEYSRRIRSGLTIVTDPQMVPMLSRVSFVADAIPERKSRHRPSEMIELQALGEAVPPEDRKPRPEIYADVLDVNPPIVKMPNYAVLMEPELAWARETLSGVQRPLVVLALHTSTSFKTWGRELELIESMPHVTFAVVGNQRFEIDMPNVISLSNKTTILQLFALVAQADAAGVGDTGLMHVAGMLGVPYVALFGAVHPSSEFTSLYDTVYPIETSYAAASALPELDLPIFDCGPCYNGKLHNCMGTDHEKWCHAVTPTAEVVDLFDSVLSQRPPQATAPKTARVDRTPAVHDVAVVDTGGLGDLLVRLNAFRQVLPKLKALHPQAQVTYIARQPYGIIEGFPGVGRWEYIEKGLVQKDAVRRATARFGLTFDLRYSGQVLRRDEEWQGKRDLGYDSGMFIGDSLASTLGEFAYTDDREYLHDHLTSVTCSPALAVGVKRAVRGAEKFIVVSNGTDPTFGLLTKRIPLDVLSKVSTDLHAAGYATVEVGTKGTEHTGTPGSINLIGKTKLEQILYLMRHDRCAGVLAADTGLAHLASHLKLPTVVLFGPTDATFWGYPANLNLTPGCDCPHMACWLTMPDWHNTCRLDVEKRLDVVPDTPPACMTSFKPEEVAASALAFYSCAVPTP
jgi:ADP-heptose:LPS heptosyltransferase